MASINELKEVLKDHLEEKGILNEIRSSLRAEIFKSLNDEKTAPKSLTKENIIINDLIKEYLEFNNYNHSLSVFESECGNPKEKLDRDILSKELNVVENKNTRVVPLIYSLVLGKKSVYEKSKVEQEIIEQGKSGDYSYKSIFDVEKKE